MALPPHAQEWFERAEIDYIGPFVKAWAAFNAWYRHASGQTQERAMLNFATRDNNSRLRRRVLPLLQNEQLDRSGQRYRAQKIQGGQIEVSVVTINSGTVKFQHVQQQYDPPSVYGLPDFTNNLSVPQQTRLRNFYDGCRSESVV